MPSWRRSKSGHMKSFILITHEKLRGIYLIDLEDKEFAETIKNARRKLETPMTLAMPCKTSKKSHHGATRGGSNKVKSKLACILEADESTRLRMGNSLPNQSWRPYCRKRRQFINSITIWFTKFIPIASSYENSCSKSSGGQGMGKLEKFSAWNLTKSQK